MSELNPLDDGVRPSPLPKPLCIRFFPPRLQFRLGLGLALALFAGIFLYAQLMEEGFSLAAWARFLLPQALILPFACRALRRYFLREVGRLEFLPKGIRLFTPHEGTTEVAYEEIAAYQVGVDDTEWFRLQTWDGRQLALSRRAYVLDAEAEGRVVRALGPRLTSTVAQTRPDPPADTIERHVWDHFGEPPPVKMVPGKRYRYMSPSYLSSAKGDMTGFIPMTGSMFPTYFFFYRLPKGALLAVIIALHSLVLLFWLAYFWRTFFLRQAGNDRFELTDEGIRVIRGNRTWILRDPRPAKGFLWSVQRFGRPLERYGRGRHTYFFDPRFLEEDRWGSADFSPPQVRGLQPAKAILSEGSGAE